MTMKKITCAVIAVVIAILCVTVPALAETDIKLTDEVYPTQITEGNTFSIYGVVTSPNDILSVTIGVYKADGGEAAFEYTGKPGTKTYDIHNVDYLMTFSKLTAGEYVYKIVATDTEESGVVLLKRDFKVLPKEQANTLKLSGATYPVKFPAGQTFSVAGTITSDYAISSVTCSVRSTNGTLMFTKTVNPGTKSYSLSNIDSYMTFSKLPAGTYVYKVSASDRYNSDMVLLEKEFEVQSEADLNTLKLTGEKYPEEYPAGQTFSIAGTVNSDYTISAVTCSVRSVDGTLMFSKTANPGTRSYSLSNLDRYMTFSKLTAGTYIYKITASDKYNTDVVLLEKEFVVLSEDQFNTLKLTGEKYPTELSLGQTFSIEGTVTSDYTISAVTCSVRTVGGTLKFSKTANPGTKSYSVSNLDGYMTFSRLAAGTYVYRITASDKYNSGVVLLEKTFTVKSLATPEEDEQYRNVKWDVIDISVWQEITSWTRIANSVDAVILRIGSRTTATKVIRQDTKFISHYENAKAKGLPVGCYFFSAATTVNEAIEEANFVLKVLRENNCKMEMPVYFDMETDAQVALSQSAATAIARAFCETIENGGYYSGIYCNKFFARDQLYADRLADFHFWIAQYSSSCTYDGPYGMWQYSETGSVSGINGYVDKNYCYYNYPEIIKKLGMSGYGNGNTEPDVPVTKPSYSFKTVEGFGVNDAGTIVYGVDDMMSADSFTQKYLNLNDGATVKFSGTVSGLIKTGTEITIMAGNETLDKFVISVKRDTDMNAKINSTDALLALQYSVGVTTLGPARRLSADVNGDGIINSTDALQILTYVVS